MCHNPTLADGTSKQSVNFATQIHSIHRGSALANPYVLGTTNYQEVGFPGDLRDCTTCHATDTYQVDNVGAVAPVASAGGLIDPTTPPITAACHGLPRRQDDGRSRGQQHRPELRRILRRLPRQECGVRGGQGALQNPVVDPNLRGIP